MRTCAHIPLQFTNPIASSLIFVHHNVTVSLKEPKQGAFQLVAVWVWPALTAPPPPEPSSVRLDTRPPPETYYAHGTSDFLNVAFYSLVWIIIHAMLQEYIWEVRASSARCLLGSCRLSLSCTTHSAYCEEAPSLQDKDVQVL